MKNLFILFAFIVCTSCNSESINNTVIEKEKLSQKNAEVNCFDSFWKEFRQATMVLDTTFLTECVSFPLQTLGREDNDPIIEISKEEFVYVFIRFLETETSIDFDNNRSYIISTSNPTQLDSSLINQGWYRMNDMEFSIINNKWKLTSIYLDTKELNILLNQR